jgi:hypothetical protein
MKIAEKIIREIEGSDEKRKNAVSKIERMKKDVYYIENDVSGISVEKEIHAVEVALDNLLLKVIYRKN